MRVRVRKLDCNLFKLGQPGYQVKEIYTQTYQYNEGEGVEPLDCREPVIIVTDASKSNGVTSVFTLDGNHVESYELSGNDRNYYHEPMSDSAYMREVLEFISQRLKVPNIVAIAQEEVLPNGRGGTGKTGSRYGNMGVQKCLTALRQVLIMASNMIWDERDPYEIPNVTWKNHTIPPEWNSKTEKGSYNWLSYLYPNILWNDDLTDSFLIGLYVLLGIRGKLRIGPDGKKSNSTVTRVEKELFKLGGAFVDKPSIRELFPPSGCQIWICDESILKGDIRKFEYNPDLTIEENAAYMTNRYSSICAAVVDYDTLPIEGIYKYALGLTGASRPVLAVQRNVEL